MFLQKEDSQPLIYIDVNLGDKKPRIVMYEEDNAEDVAAEFAQTHSK